MSTNRVYFVRHGESPSNVTGDFSLLRADEGLTARGVVQARQTADYLAEKAVSVVFSSPLRRAVETAEISAATIGVSLVLLPEFAEIDVGDLASEPPSPERWGAYFSVMNAWFAGDRSRAYPGGEDYWSVWGRMERGLRSVLDGRRCQNVAVVVHGGLLMATIRQLCSDAPEVWYRRMANHNCAITEAELEIKQGGQLRGHLVRWAWDGHLSGKAVQADARRR